MNLTKYIGIPYAPQGRTWDHLDCYGVVYLVYKEERGIDLPSYADDYADPGDREEAAAAVEKNVSAWRKVLEPQPFDVLVFNMLGLPAHCGLYLGNGDFLHSLKGTETCIERLNSITWHRRLAGVYRWAN